MDLDNLLEREISSSDCRLKHTQNMVSETRGIGCRGLNTIKLVLDSRKAGQQQTRLTNYLILYLMY